MRKTVYLIGILLTGLVSAQKPFVNGISKSATTATDIVTISGLNFSGSGVQALDGSGTEVYFGKGKSQNVNVISSSLIEAEVPATATYGPVIVRNSDGSIGMSGQGFSMSFDVDAKAAGFTNRSALKTTSTSNNFTYDLCTCDFDGDELNDLILTNNEAGNLSVYLNSESATDPFSAAPANFSNTAEFSHNITCGDLNGDGKPDIAVTTDDATKRLVSIYPNTSTLGSITFGTRILISVPASGTVTRRLKQVRIADMDGDGLQDIIVGNSADGDNVLYIYKNTSTLKGAISFSPSPFTFTVAGSASTGSFDVGDLNNDNRPDIALIPNGRSGVIYLIKNQSSVGSFSLSLVKTVGNTANRRRIIIADFNQDGDNDFAISREAVGIEIYENTNPSSLNFTTISKTDTGVDPWGLDVGDVNGDGKPDILSASLGDNLLYYQNNSTGSINFSSANKIGVGELIRNVIVGDFTNDGKPDIAFTYNSVNNIVGSLGYIINQECMTPVINPDQGIYCTNSDFFLNATKGVGVVYTWDVSGDDPLEDSSTLNLNGNGYAGNKTITVTAAAPGGCSAQSAAIGLSHDNTDSPAGTPDIDTSLGTNILCAGEVLRLTTTAVATNYNWYGPNGYISSTTSPTNFLEIAASATTNHSGTYGLTVDNAACESSLVNITITVSSPPATAIAVSDCDAGSITMELPDLTGQGISYQWLRGVTPAGNLPSLTTSTLGQYSVVLTDGNTCDFTTEVFEIFASDFVGSIPALGINPLPGTTNLQVCSGVATTFTSSQTGSGITNSWEIEDPSATVTTASGNSMVQTFNTTGTWTIRLLSNYSSPNFGIGCSEKTITVTDAPTYTADVSPGTTKCPSEEVTLSFSETDVLSYSWDDLAATSGPLTVTEAGTYTATYITDKGCEVVADPVVITNLPGLDLVSQTPPIVDNMVQLADGQLSVNLSVALTATNIVWEINPVSAGNIISGTASSQQVEISLSAPQATITVSGTVGSCDESETVTVINGSSVPRNSFSPNGDGLNDDWKIVNSSLLDGCTVYILDGRGAHVFVTKLPAPGIGGDPDSIWDGRFNGKMAPEGVYYYVIKCSDSSANQSGSILLAR